ncbi:MAG TPA: HAD family phosphatase [Phycisphaerales bacterium]|nr:HAD family phosphatase [Phycisphaerales bacterium]
MLKAVIFDFDGVICDSEVLHYRALNTVFNRYGVDVPKAVHWERYLGFSDRENIEAVNQDYRMGLDSAGVRRLMAEKKEAFESLVRAEPLLIDGVQAFVRMLVEHGVRRAICSGALRSDIDLMLAGSGLDEAFEAIVTADDVTCGKPDPEGYLTALQELNIRGDHAIKPSECVVIEDSHWGIEAALAAGMHPIAVTNTYSREELEAKAELVSDNLGHITMEMIRRLCE